MPLPPDEVGSQADPGPAGQIGVSNEQMTDNHSQARLRQQQEKRYRIAPTAPLVAPRRRESRELNGRREQQDSDGHHEGQPNKDGQTASLGSVGFPEDGAHMRRLGTLRHEVLKATQRLGRNSGESRSAIHGFQPTFQKNDPPAFSTLSMLGDRRRMAKGPCQSCMRSLPTPGATGSRLPVARRRRTLFALLSLS